MKQRRQVSSGEDNHMKLAEIKTILAGNPTEEQLTELKKDERAGVQKLLAAYDKKRKTSGAWPCKRCCKRYEGLGC